MKRVCFILRRGKATHGSRVFNCLSEGGKDNTRVDSLCLPEKGEAKKKCGSPVTVCSLLLLLFLLLLFLSFLLLSFSLSFLLLWWWLLLRVAVVDACYFSLANFCVCAGGGWTSKTTQGYNTNERRLQLPNYWTRLAQLSNSTYFTFRTTESFFRTSFNDEVLNKSSLASSESSDLLQNFSGLGKVVWHFSPTEKSLKDGDRVQELSHGKVTTYLSGAVGDWRLSGLFSWDGSEVELSLDDQVHRMPFVLIYVVFTVFWRFDDLIGNFEAPNFEAPPFWSHWFLIDMWNFHLIHLRPIPPAGMARLRVLESQLPADPRWRCLAKRAATKFVDAKKNVIFQCFFKPSKWENSLIWTNRKYWF